MKMYLSAFLPLLILLALVGCSKEQFGSIPQTEKNTVNGLQSFEQLSCSTYTLIKPKVDILYVVDNSSSTYYLPSDVKTALKNTVDTISKEFDYRIIGTPLLETAGANEDYQVMTNSQDRLDQAPSGHKIISSSEFNFYSNQGTGIEKGLNRIQSFINAHDNANDGLFRKQAYLIIVLLSNGYDEETERLMPFGNQETGYVYSNLADAQPSCSGNACNLQARKNSFASIKTNLQSQQLRFISVTPRTQCKSGWRSTHKSYIAMSRYIYSLAGNVGTNDSQYPDNYDLCTNSITNIFASFNSSIKQVIVPHEYRYAPITFADVNTNNASVNEIDTKVYKVTGNSAPVEIPNTAWDIDDRGSNVSVPLRELPTLGEAVTGRYFVKFINRIVYPDCVLVKSVSRTEYFGYIVLPKEPKPETIVVRVNGVMKAQSATDGWTYIGNPGSINIKVAYPNAGDEIPAVTKSGFMIQLNGSNNYYKSGDSVEVSYLPAGI